MKKKNIKQIAICICLVVTVGVVISVFTINKYMTNKDYTLTSNTSYVSKNNDVEEKNNLKENEKSNSDAISNTSNNDSKDNLPSNVIASNDTGNKKTDVVTNTQEAANSNGNGQSKADSKPNYNYKDFFKNDVFLGDSISEELSFYEFLDEANVAAKKGVNIYRAKDEVDKVVAQNPKRIFILFGANDMDGTLTSEQFVGYYDQIIKNIKEKLPNCQIYVQSIFPVLPEVAKNKPYLGDEYVNEFNAALINMAKRDNIHYINVASVLNSGNQNLYEPDGIHFKSDFCPLWLNYIIENINK